MMVEVTARLPGWLRRDPVPLIACSLPALFVYLVQTLGQHPLFIDDSFIFYRYAANWADGYGPVFNPGERVEGYSSPLWTAVLALGARLSISPPDFAPVAGLLLGAACFLLICGLTKALLPQRPWLWIAVPLAAALSSGLAAYAISGMDTVPFAFVLLAAMTGAVRAIQSGRTGLLLVSMALLVFVRAEGILYAVAILVVLGILVRSREATVDVRSLRGAVAVVAIAFIVQEGARLIYYGDIVPATVSAKGYATGGLIDVIESGFTNWGQFENALFLGFKYERAVVVMTALPLAGLVLRANRRDDGTAIAWLIAAPIVVNLAVTAWSAGDWMPLQRLNLAVLPLIVLLIAWELTRVVENAATEPSVAGPGPVVWRTLVIVLVILIFGGYSLERSLMRPAVANVTSPQEDGFSRYSRELGERLASAQPSATVLTDVVGKVGYYGGAHTYVWDMLGLTDEHNAEHGERWRPSSGRSDDAYNFSRPFDVLLTDNVVVLERAIDYWQSHPELNAGAAYQVLPNPDWLESRFYLIVRKDHPLSSALVENCACTPIPLTTGFVRDHRTRLDQP